MHYLLPIITTVCFVFYCNTVKSQNSLQQILNLQANPNVYSTKKIADKITIDGKMESIWDKAAWSSEFVDIEGSHKTKPRYSTQVKMLWDDEFLYVYAKLMEPHIWGILTQKDAIIYHDNDFEIFLKPNSSSSIYYEIEVNALNTIMDLMMPKPYRFGGQAMLHWDTQHIQSAIHMEGTLNNPADTDRYWAVEMAIPFKSLRKFGNRITPKLNDYWRINFSRVQWQHHIEDKKYTRKKENNKLLAENNWVWSPIGLVNMHYPERWGFLYFTENAETNALPPSYKMEKLAWNIFYLQQLAHQKNSKYEFDIKQLEGYAEILKNDLEDYTLQVTLSEDKHFYHIVLKDKNSKYFTIDSQGNYTTNYE